MKLVRAVCIMRRYVCLLFSTAKFAPRCYKAFLFVLRNGDKNATEMCLRLLTWVVIADSQQARLVLSAKVSMWGR